MNSSKLKYKRKDKKLSNNFCNNITTFCQLTKSLCSKVLVPSPPILPFIELLKKAIYTCKLHPYKCKFLALLNASPTSFQNYLCSFSGGSVYSQTKPCLKRYHHLPTLAQSCPFCPIFKLPILPIFVWEDSYLPAQERKKQFDIKKTFWIPIHTKCDLQIPFIPCYPVVGVTCCMPLWHYS